MHVNNHNPETGETTKGEKTMFSIGNILTGLIMAGAFLGMLYCAKIQRKKRNARYIAVGLMIVVLICCFMFIFGGGDSDIAAIMETEQTYAKAAASTLAEHIAKSKPKSVLVIASPNYKNNNRETAIIESIKEYLPDAKVDNLVSPKVRLSAGTDPATPPPESLEDNTVTAAQFNDLLARNPKADMIICLIGLPLDVNNMEIWKQDGKIMAILFADVTMLRKAIASGKVIAVSFKPGVRLDQEACPSDVKEAFDRRYLLIDKNNIADVAKKYKEFFPKN